MINSKILTSAALAALLAITVPVAGSTDASAQVGVKGGGGGGGAAIGGGGRGGGPAIGGGGRGGGPAIGGGGRGGGAAFGGGGGRSFSGGAIGLKGGGGGGPVFSGGGRPAFSGGGGQRWAGGNPGWHGGRSWHGGRGWRGGYYPGVAAGLALGGSYAYYGSPYYDDSYYGYYDEPTVAVVPGGGDSVAYCQQRFKSYDPASGTYLGYDGQRHPCP